MLQSVLLTPLRELAVSLAKAVVHSEKMRAEQEHTGDVEFPSAPGTNTSGAQRLSVSAEILNLVGPVAQCKEGETQELLAMRRMWYVWLGRSRVGKYLSKILLYSRAVVTFDECSMHSSPK